MDDGQGRRRGGGQGNAAEDESQIKGQPLNQQDDAEDQGNEGEGAQGLHQGDADNLFAGTANFTEHDFSADHDTRKAFRKFDEDLIGGSIGNVRCNDAGQAGAEKDAGQQPAEDGGQLDPGHQLAAEGGGAEKGNNTQHRD